MVTSNAAKEYVAKINMLRLNIGSGMLRLSSCMLRLGLRLSIGSCMLRLGLRLKLRLSFRGSGWPPLNQARAQAQAHACSGSDSEEAAGA